MKWVFFDTLYKPLSRSDVEYWKLHLSRVLKIGFEFEYNIKDNTGNCLGDRLSCVCRHMKTKECWKKCALSSECTEECTGLTCTNFVPACHTCDDFDTGCMDCKRLRNPAYDPDNIRKKLRKSLKPNQSYGKINSSGVYNIVCDGSLKGEGAEGKGVEIITTGRRVYFHKIYSMCKNIVNEVIKTGRAYTDERCSIHIHLLNSYYNDVKEYGNYTNFSSFENPMPEIILANFHQLCRKYQNAITWMSMGLNTREHMTRWEKYRASILKVSPIVSGSMSLVRDVLAEITGKGGGKYGWVNYMYTGFSANNTIERLHIEMRVMDGMLAPSPPAAIAFLFYTMLLKAVELSRYGVFILDAGEDDISTEKQLSLEDKILNNNPEGWAADHRFSNTDRLQKQDEAELIEQGQELLQLLKHLLMQEPQAFNVLEKLAETPVAKLRIRSYSWEEVENFYLNQEKEGVVEDAVAVIEEYIDKFIDTCEIKATSRDGWLNMAVKLCADELGKKEFELLPVVSSIVNDKLDKGLFVWSSSIETFIRV